VGRYKVLSYVYCALAVILGFLCQKAKKISFAVLFVSYIISIVISNDALISLLSDYTGIDRYMIILIGVLFYGSSTFSSSAIKSRTIKKYNQRVEYADYMMKMNVQNILNSFRDDIERCSSFNLKSNDLMVTLFFVKGNFIKKLIRVGFSDNLPKILSDWDGVITKLNRTITGRTVIDGNIQVVENFKNACIDGLPKDIQRWTKGHLKLRISIPIKKDIKVGFAKKETVKFVICLSSQKNFLLNKNENQIHFAIDTITNILHKYLDSIDGLYEYYSYM